MNYLKVIVISLSAAVTGLLGLNKTPTHPIATTTTSMVATTTVATAQVPVKKAVPKAVIETTKAELPAAQPAISSDDTQTDIATLNSWIAAYQKQIDLLKQLKANDVQAVTMSENIGDNTGATAFNAFIDDGLVLTIEAQSYSDAATNEITQIENTGYEDKSVWNAAKFASMQTDLDNLSTAVSNLYTEDTDAENLSDEYIEQQNDAVPVTQSTSDDNDQLETECGNVDQEVRNEVSSGGGFASESQIDALVQKKEQSLGCENGTIPTAECNDLTESYSTNRSGTCSDHGGVLEWL